MAIDNAEKRRAVAGIAFGIIASVTPNAAKDVEWRQQVALGYSGITPNVLVVYIQDIALLGQRTLNIAAMGKRTSAIAIAGKRTLIYALTGKGL